MANKLFFDLYSTSGEKMPKEEYKKFYEKNNMVYIVLVDKKIYTKVARQEMFEKGLHHGCFLESYPYDTPKEVETHAMLMVKRVGARYVDPVEFQIIEEQGEQERTQRAFAYAERLISEN